MISIASVAFATPVACEESCHTYQWVMSHLTHINESCPLYVCECHVQQVMSRTRISPVTHINESCPISVCWVMSHIYLLSHVPCTFAAPLMCCVMSPTRMFMSRIWLRHNVRRDVRVARPSSHATRVNTSCHTHVQREQRTRRRWIMLRMCTHEDVMAHAMQVWMSHATYVNASCHIYEWVLPHRWMRHGTYRNESCHIYACVMPHIPITYATHMNESWHTKEWVMAHIGMGHGMCMNASWHVNECVMARVWIRHSYMNESQCIYKWA